MRKFLKYFLWLLGGIVSLVIIAGLYINFSGIPKYTPQHVDLKVKATPARLARGKVLASMLCANCHLEEHTGAFTGRRMSDLPKAFGVAFSKNITQDPTYGIAKWTDGEIAVLLRTGL